MLKSGLGVFLLAPLWDRWEAADACPSGDLASNRTIPRTAAVAAVAKSIVDVFAVGPLLVDMADLDGALQGLSSIVDWI